MVARVQSISEASREEWLSAAKACPYATYFHTPYWYGLIAPGQGHTALSVCFDDGASAIIPIAKVKRMCGLLVDHFSSPGGTYGGWISGSALGEGHVMALLDILISKKNLTFRVNPFDEMSPSVISSLTIPSPTESLPIKSSSAPLSTSITITDDFTHTLDLTKGEQAIFSGLTKGHRSAIRSAARDGVTVKAAESIDEWERYYNLYMDSVRRWRAGGPSLKPRKVYPLSLFKRIYENRTGNEILWLAVKGGEPVAGALFFYWGRHAVSWHGAAASAHFGLRPNNLLYWEILLDAERRGYEIFDFNPSGGYGGVESFKKHFGAARIPAPVLSTRTPLRALVTRARLYLSAR
jgi:hypothetical protein